MTLDEISLKDAVEFVVDNRGKTVPIEQNGIPLIATNCINNDSLYPEFINIRHVSEDIYKNWFRAHPQPDDIILTNKGSQNGAICLVPDPVNFCIAQDMVALRAKKGVIYPRYLFAALRSKLVQTRIKDLNVDSVIPHFKKTDFDKLFFPKPSYHHQILIGDLYFNFCQKIHLNTQTNQTLESIAQAIFKSWFVDFEPVKAKMAALAEGGTREQAELAVMGAISGKSEAELAQLQQQNPEHYQQLAETAALFPSALVESELGEIPEGWEVSPLPELIDFMEGPGIRNWQYTESDDGIKFINIRCIKNGDLSLETASKITAEEAFGKYSHFQLNVDDIVISSSGTLGRYAFIRSEHLPLCLNTSVLRFRPITGVTTLHYLHGFVDTQLQWELEIRASGSAQRNFGPMHLKQIVMLKPTYEILLKHSEHLESSFRKRQSNLKEIDSLTKLRDSLLPKLLSGEIDLSDIQSEVA